MSSDYTRSLLVSCLRRRKHLFTFIANNAHDAPTNKEVAEAARENSDAAASYSAAAAGVSTAAWPVNLHVCEFERIDWGAGLSGQNKGPLIVSSFPVRKGLIRKAQLSFTLRKYAAKRPDSILHQTVPETHIMSIDDPAYLDEALNDVYEVRDMIPGEDMWIMKASMVNRAMGIHLITCVEDVERIIQDEAYAEIREWVMQRYIQRPYLINGCKFHIRVYVLAIGNLRASMWSQMLCLIAPEKYDRNNLDRAAHITNTCANADREGFKESDQIKLLEEVLTKEELTHVHRQMSATIHELFAALHGEPTIFLPIPNGFEHYGMDFILDSQLGCYFLEANAGPDFGMTGERLQGLVAGMMEHTFRQAVDPCVQEAIEKGDIQIQQPQTEEEKRQAEEETRTFTGEFIPCYEVLNKSQVTMNFY